MSRNDWDYEDEEYTEPKTSGNGFWWGLLLGLGAGIIGDRGVQAVQNNRKQKQRKDPDIVIDIDPSNW